MLAVVSRINSAIHVVTDIIVYIVRVNYFLGEALFTLLSWALGHVATGTHALLAFFKVAIYDFSLFIEDITGYISGFCAFSEYLINIIGQGIFSVFYSFLSALASFVSVVIGVGTSLYVTISSVLESGKHFSQVVGRSIFFLVKDIPISFVNVLKEGCHGLLQIYLSLKAAYLNVIAATWQIFFDQYLNARSIFKGIPGEAYLGMLLIGFLLYMAQRFIRFVYKHRSIIGRRFYWLIVIKFPRTVKLTYTRIFESTMEMHTELAAGDDSSTTSSLDSTPPPYNLRQRKPNQRSRHSSIRALLQQEKEEKLCVICSDKRKDSVVLPCRHFSFCMDCISTAVKYNSYCPICRTDIEEIVPVFQ